MLGEVAILDVLIFLSCLAPQLIVHIGLGDTILCVLNALPFLVFQLPLDLTRERFFSKHRSRGTLSQRTSLFHDVVIRCVRYAFANIPARVGAVFFSKPVALPFYKFRLLRHGHLRSPFYYEEVNTVHMKGLRVVQDPRSLPDVVVFYCHGGGFSMGSSYFYLEFLVSWLSHLKSRQGWRNPAAFLLEYTLVPHASFPRQLDECRAGYDYALRELARGKQSRLCLAGDSAGATLIMSLLLSNAIETEYEKFKGLAAFVTLISPWCKLLSERNKNTDTDYLDNNSLRLYAQQYLGMVTFNSSQGNDNIHRYEREWKELPAFYQLASPGDCKDDKAWSWISKHNFHIIYGSEEVFAPETRSYINRLEQEGARIDVTEGDDVHAWPIADLFLRNGDDRVKGLDRIVEVMGRNMVE